MPATHATHLSGSPLSLSPCHRASMYSPKHACTSPTQRNTHMCPERARPDAPEPCQARGERALARHWTPQYHHSPARSRPSLAFSLCTRTRLHSCVLLDILISTRERPSRRHDQSLPCPYREDATVASTPQTIIGRPFKRASTA
jgi:hypothetical protein